MDRDQWDALAVATLRQFVNWWESESKTRRLDAQEAHDLANAVMAADQLILEYDERETDGPPEAHSDA